MKLLVPGLSFLPSPSDFTQRRVLHWSQGLRPWTDRQIHTCKHHTTRGPCGQGCVHFSDITFLNTHAHRHSLCVLKSINLAKHRVTEMVLSPRRYSSCQCQDGESA